MTAFSKDDLNTLSFAELTQLIEDAKVALESKKDAAKASLVDEMKKRAAELGLDINSLISAQAPATGRSTRSTRSDAGQKVSPKYGDKRGNTWTGRGRKPLWLVTAEAEGKTLNDFLLKA